MDKENTNSQEIQGIRMVLQLGSPLRTKKAHHSTMNILSSAINHQIISLLTDAQRHFQPPRAHIIETSIRRSAAYRERFL